MKITIKKTVNETVEIQFPIYLRQSPCTVIAIYSEDKIIDVNNFDNIDNYSLGKKELSIEFLINSYTFITMEEYNAELKKCIEGITKNISLANMYEMDAHLTATPKEIQQLNDERNQEMKEDWNETEVNELEDSL